MVVDSGLTSLSTEGVRSAPVIAQVEAVPGQRPVFAAENGRVAVYDGRYGRLMLGVGGSSRRSGVVREVALPFAPSPVGLFVREDTAWILDRSRTLVIAHLRDSSAILLRKVAVTHRVEGLCATSDRLFIRGFDARGPLVHAYTLDGTPTESFARPVDAPSSLMQAQLSRGGIYCDDVANVVLLTFDALSEWQGFSESGEQLFAQRIPSYQPIRASGGWDPEPFVVRDYSTPFDEVWGIRTLAGDTSVVLGATREIVNETIVVHPWQRLIRWSLPKIGPRVDVAEVTLAIEERASLTYDGKSLRLTSSRAASARR
jgi:hypothetical protein